MLHHIDVRAEGESGTWRRFTMEPIECEPGSAYTILQAWLCTCHSFEMPIEPSRARIREMTEEDLREDEDRAVLAEARKLSGEERWEMILDSVRRRRAATREAGK